MSLEQQHKESLQTTQEQKTLIMKLEADLSQVQPFLAVGVEGTKETSSSAEIISNALRDVETDRAKVSVSGDAVGGASSLLPIVSSQRERFKQRNMELEAVSLSNHSNLSYANCIIARLLTHTHTLSLSQESHQQKQTISVLQREVDSIRGDNVKLYEKIKFLQSYPGTVRQLYWLLIDNVIIIISARVLMIVRR